MNTQSVTKYVFTGHTRHGRRVELAGSLSEILTKTGLEDLEGDLTLHYIPRNPKFTRIQRIGHVYGTVVEEV